MVKFKLTVNSPEMRFWHKLTGCATIKGPNHENALGSVDDVNAFEERMNLSFICIEGKTAHSNYGGATLG